MEYLQGDKLASANNANIDNATSSIEIPTNGVAENEVLPQILDNCHGEPVSLPAPGPSVVVDMPPKTEDEQPQGETNPNDETQDKKEVKKNQYKGKPKEEVTFRTHLTSLAHVSVLVFVYLILKLAFRGEFVFFTWHPILMVLGWMLLMTEGFYAINKYNTYWRFKTKGGFRVKVHMATLSLGYILVLIGFAIVYINKDNNDKPHFATWHALFGLIAIASTFPPVINGFILWYSKELSKYVTNPRLAKFIHVSSGTIAFFFGALALILSVYSKWYGRKSNHSDSLFYFGLVTATFPVFWAVYGPSVKLARVIKEYFSENKED